MSQQTQTETVKAARKTHVCDWCGERIDIGTTYRRYRWFQHGGAGTCRMHPECHGAMELAADEEGGWIEFCPGDNERPHAQPNTV